VWTVAVVALAAFAANAGLAAFGAAPAQALPGYCVGVNEHVGSGSVCTP
jgi:hypothetical protein